MARASTYTKLPLTTWARLMGLNPLHFEQVKLQDNEFCSQIYFQHEWQTADHVSREEIATAIAEAESKIENTLHYRLAPCWEVDEWRETVRPGPAEFINITNGDVRGYKQTVKANWGYMISGGIQAKTVIEAGANIVWSDRDSDGYFETGTIVVTTVVLDKNEIALYYPSHDGEDAWEIRPINVVIASGTATITFRRELAVLEDIQEALIRDTTQDDYLAADGYDDDDFLETADVYRKYNDPQAQASFLWEPLNNWCGECGGSGCSSCAYSTQTGCLAVRGDPRQSILSFSPADWNQDDLTFNTATWNMAQQPDIVRLYYYSGWRKKDAAYISRLDPEWERTIAYMAAALLDRPPCDCMADVWKRHREDLALVQGDSEQGFGIYKTPTGQLDNPFGTRRGEVDAWRKVRSKIIGSAVLV